MKKSMRIEELKALIDGWSDDDDPVTIDDEEISDNNIVVNEYNPLRQRRYVWGDAST